MRAGPTGSMRARWVSAEVVGRASHVGTGESVPGSVIGRFGATLHAEVGGFVVAVLPADATRMPNGLAIAAPAGPDPRWPRVGEPAALSTGAIELGRLTITWTATGRARSNADAHDQVPIWDARVPHWSPAGRAELRARGGAILAASSADSGGPGGDSRVEPTDALRRIGGLDGGDRGARHGLTALLDSLDTLDPRRAARAAELLLGRGPGLTPVGDDVLAAAALTAAAAAGAVGFGRTATRRWLAALVPPALRARTTPVSATLLELAARGRGIGTAQALLDPLALPAKRLAAEVHRLLQLGHTTGGAYANTIGACALALAESQGSRAHSSEIDPETQVNTGRVADTDTEIAANATVESTAEI